MLWKVVLFCIICHRMSLAMQITTINNAIFDPINMSYLLTSLSNIASCDLCICQCYAKSNCITANYYGQHQECVLFSASLIYEQLHVTSTSENTTVINLYNRNYSAVATTYSTSSILTTVANNLCAASTSYVLAYTTSPTSYQQQTYSYTALSIGVATLEFGFKAKNPAKTWHLDDVSVVDSSLFNLQMLTNGGFEYGSSIGWQVACSSQNCGGTGGAVVQSSCHSGSYCYQGACQGAYDFLRQSFFIIPGHVYVLSFWVYTDGHSAEAAYVNIQV